MEDAHISLPALTRKKESSKEVPVSLFGVFDGHGGKEVAKFVKLKYPELLLGLESFQKGDYEKALKESFHGIDVLLENEVTFYPFLCC
jgi:serine/threonine protein phosphatase PrpC